MGVETWADSLFFWAGAAVTVAAIALIIVRKPWR